MSKKWIKKKEKEGERFILMEKPSSFFAHTYFTNRVL
jgi:hypothetical protein